MTRTPASWSEVTVGEVAQVTSGIGFPKHFQGQTLGDLPFYKVGDISRAVQNNRGFLAHADHYVSHDIARELRGRPLEPGSTVFAKIGEAIALNRRAFVQVPCLVDNNVMAVKAGKNVLDRYIYYFLCLCDLSEFARSTTVPSLRKGDIENLHLPLPPLAEQQRIADKLDVLLRRVDACRVRLARVPAILKRFRQAVLAAATSGRLTEEWREGNGKATDWLSTTFGAAGNVSGGLTKNAGRLKIDFRKPYLRVANVYANRLDLSDVAEIGLTEAEYKKTKLVKDDLLIVEGNGSLDQIGRAAIWTAELPDCVHQNHLIRWRTHGKALPRFALLWLLSPQGRAALIDVASSTTGLHTLSISKVAALAIELPPLDEQHEIVRRVETLFAYADRLEARYAAAREQVEQLTPSLLAKAFRGEMVPQQPGEEGK